MIADAFSPVNILEQGAQMAKGEQSRMVLRCPSPACRAAAPERRRMSALAPTHTSASPRPHAHHAPLPPGSPPSAARSLWPTS